MEAGGIGPKTDIVIKLNEGGFINLQTMERRVQKPDYFKDLLNGRPRNRSNSRCLQSKTRHSMWGHCSNWTGYQRNRRVHSGLDSKSPCQRWPPFSLQLFPSRSCTNRICWARTKLPRNVLTPSWSTEHWRDWSCRSSGIDPHCPHGARYLYLHR